MACRVGMSTTPYTRIEYWRQREGHTHGKVLAARLTYEDAQAQEKQEAERRNCYAEPGGEHVPGRVWSVYVVSGGFVPPRH